jgi:glutathione S-transferase
LHNKPAWFAEKGFNATPIIEVMRQVIVLHVVHQFCNSILQYGGEFLDDSEKICSFLEKKCPEPSLTPLAVGGTDPSTIGSRVFPSFVQLLKACKVPGKESEREEKESQMVAQLQGLEDILKRTDAFLCGDELTSVDMGVAPKLKHARVVLDRICGWQFPGWLEYWIAQLTCSKA